MIDLLKKINSKTEEHKGQNAESSRLCMTFAILSNIKRNMLGPMQEDDV